MRHLQWKVECKFTHFYEVIAAFDCDTAALNYAAECAKAHPLVEYRVTKRRNVLKAYNLSQ